MEQLREILAAHARRYPLMEPTDAVKLIYQNEFGGGHLIREEAACLDFLRQEYAGVVHDPHAPPYEDIGNGLVRIHLAALPPEELEALGQNFIRSAAAHRGNLENFKKKLEVLRRAAQENVFSFSASELDTYLTEYEKAGYPMVSHSHTYRENYHPAYRVIVSPF